MSQLAKADGTIVDHAALLLELIPPHKRHHFTTVEGRAALNGLASGLAAPAYDDTALRAHVQALEQTVQHLAAQLAQVIAHLKQHEADLLSVHHAVTHHTHETIRQVA